MEICFVVVQKSVKLPGAEAMAMPSKGGCVPQPCGNLTGSKIFHLTEQQTWEHADMTRCGQTLTHFALLWADQTPHSCGQCDAEHHGERWSCEHWHSFGQPAAQVLEGSVF